MVKNCTVSSQDYTSPIWHPCSQMKDYVSFPPLMVERAQGSYFYLENGQRIIDAISSWWCKSLGHGHPRLKQALIQQAEKFEHVIFANTTHETIIRLSEKLTTLCPTLTKVFYASEGSSAVEIALKMSLHARKIMQQPERHRFMALQNAYHGETGLALSVSDLGIYRKAYAEILVDVPYLAPLPYLQHRINPLWDDCSAYWPAIEKQLNYYADSLTALIVEPVVQAAAGMQLYSPDLLRRLRQWTQANDVHFIADEIMTGFGRTGLPLACQHAAITADFVCLGKSLTAGWLPLSAVLTNDTIYQLFYADYSSGHNFLHSHTFSGNALAASVALACLEVLQEENIYQRVALLEQQLYMRMQQIAATTGRLQNVRGIGALVAADLVAEQGERLGYQVYREAVARGALLRPLGNTIYWCPPFNITDATLTELQRITQEAILA